MIKDERFFCKLVSDTDTEIRFCTGPGGEIVILLVRRKMKIPKSRENLRVDDGI